MKKMAKKIKLGKLEERILKLLVKEGKEIKTIDICKRLNHSSRSVRVSARNLRAKKYITSYKKGNNLYWQAIKKGTKAKPKPKVKKITHKEWWKGLTVKQRLQVLESNYDPFEKNPNPTHETDKWFYIDFEEIVEHDLDYIQEYFKPLYKEINRDYKAKTIGTHRLGKVSELTEVLEEHEKERKKKKYVIIDKHIDVKQARKEGKINNYMMKGTGNKKVFDSRKEAELYRINYGLQNGKIILK